MEPAIKPVNPKDYVPSSGFTSIQEQEKKSKKKKKFLKGLGIFFGIVLGLILIAYLAGVFYFTNRFMPYTNIGDFNVSMMSKADAATLIDETTADYQISVEGQGLSFVLSSHDAGFDIDSEGIVTEALKGINPWLWPMEMQKTYDKSEALVASYGQDGMGQAIQSYIDEINEDATQPVNATIDYDDEKDSYVVVPEQAGTALDRDAVMEQIGEAIVELAPSVTITEAALAMPEVLSSEPNLQTACDSANELIRANFEVVMGGSTVSYVNPDLLSEWITLDENLSATLDESEIEGWAITLSSVLGTIGSERTYTREDGKEVKVSGGVYGWEVDVDAFVASIKEAVSAGQTENLEVPTLQQAAVYTKLGARDWGDRYIDVDIAEQHARFYDNGKIIWEADFISGRKGTHDTTLGVNYLNNKEAPSILIGYKEDGKTKEYETPVRYWMPFIYNSIGFHDADWQGSGFGGNRYAEGLGSHGCINLSVDKATELWEIIEIGDVVITHM